MSTDDDLNARLDAAGERWRAANKTIADVDLGYLEIPAEPVDVTVTPTAAAKPRRRRMRVALGAASGIAAAVAATLVVLQLGGSGGTHRTKPASGAAGVQIVCQTTRPATTAQLQADASTIANRINGFVPGGGSVHIQDSKSVVITLPNGPKDSAQGLCAQAQFDLRPLVMPAASVAPGAATRNSDPFAAVTFAIPTTDAGFAALNAAQQAQLKAALGRLDCAWAAEQSSSAAPYAFACQSNDSKSATLALLLGPAVVPGSDVTAATAQEPNVSVGQAEWSIALTLKPAAQAAWSKYTGSHNIRGSQGVHFTTDCGVATTPCADYVGFDLDGIALTVPVNEDQIRIDSQTQIAGNFTEKTAKALAGQLSSGALAVPLRVVSTTDLPVPTTVPVASKLVGVEWELVRLVGPDGSNLSGAALTIGANGQLTGSDGCNTLSAPVTISGDTIIIASVITTDMACNQTRPGDEAQIRQLDKVLSGTVQWSVQGGQLTLSKSGKVVAVYKAMPGPTTDPKALTASEWKLTSVAGDGPNGSASTVPAGAKLVFDSKGGFTASDGCNSGGGKVTVTPGALKISGYVSTKMACAGAPPQLGLVNRILDGSVTWSIKDGQLTLTKAGVGSLTYSQH